MADILIADIGGTNSRATLASRSGRPEQIVSIPNDSVDGPEALLARMIEAVPRRPQAAVLALAAPVSGDEIALTNRDWVLRLADLSACFGLSPLHALNDFEALAFALPQLNETDLRPLGEAASFPPGVKLAIGPGTGLGVAALVPASGGLHAIASEAGHVSFGPAYPDEWPVFHRLAERNTPLLAESILSGAGIAALHCALHPGTMMPKPEMLMRQAQAGDRTARATVAMFVRLLGRFAGDMALAFRATGGVYIAGGVATGLGALLDARLFRAAFERHPPYEAMLKRVPSALITCAEPGLIGAMAVAKRLMASS